MSKGFKWFIAALAVLVVAYIGLVIVPGWFVMM